MKCKAYDTFFNNFANQTSLRIIYLLRRGPLSVGEITRRINEEQSQVSHRLRRLSECGILSGRRRGKQKIYSLNKRTIVPILKLVEKHVGGYCRGRCRG